MIEKKIHYIWLGRNKQPEMMVKCIASWKKYCPDYEIIEWNEDNFDVNCIRFTKEAYECKKWSLVTDYMRMKILFEQGGIYVDTDVEFIKPIDDLLTSPIIGYESETIVNPGSIMACESGDTICKEMMTEYENENFILPDGSYNYYILPTRFTNALARNGLTQDNKYQENVAGYNVYPIEYFAPLNYETRKLNMTDNTYTIHHFDGSWHSPWRKFKNKIIRFIGKDRVVKILKAIKR